MRTILTVLTAALFLQGSAQTAPAGFLQRQGTDLVMDGKPFRAIAVNKFDLFLQYLRGGEERQQAETAMREAAEHGFKVIRFAGVGFWPQDMKQWADTENWWKAMDSVVADAAKLGIWLIPTINWNTYLFPDMAHECVQDMLTNRNSRSWQYMEAYTVEFVKRYKDNPTILMWEISNELNLGADIESTRPHGFHDLCGVHLGGPPVRLRRDNFTTDQMISYVRDVAKLVRSLDPNHLITPGYSSPRPPAQHLRRNPKKGDWTHDSEADVVRWYRDTHPSPAEVISVHFYPEHDNIRFGNTDVQSAEPLRKLKRLADKAGMPLFLGEVYGPIPYMKHVLQIAIEEDIPIVLIWQWHTPWQADYDVTPAKAPELVRMMREANEQRRRP